MKKLTGWLLFCLALVPATTTPQTNLTGDWNATFTATRPDGTTQSITFHFIQKGKDLSGTVGPEPARQWKIEKGIVDGANVTFQVQQPDGGPLRQFTLTEAKGRLQGIMKLTAASGQTLDVKVDAERAKGK
jgi:hypothetical protein